MSVDEEDDERGCAEQFERGCLDCEEYDCPYRDYNWNDPMDEEAKK